MAFSGLDWFSVEAVGVAVVGTDGEGEGVGGEGAVGWDELDGEGEVAGGVCLIDRECAAVN